MYSVYLRKLTWATFSTISPSAGNVIFIECTPPYTPILIGIRALIVHFIVESKWENAGSNRAIFFGADKVSFFLR